MPQHGSEISANQALCGGVARLATTNKGFEQIAALERWPKAAQ